MDRAYFITILTIEDDRLVRKAIAICLQNRCYIVLQAANCEEELELFRRTPYFIITDRYGRILRVENPPGEGSLFLIELPMKKTRNSANG